MTEDINQSYPTSYEKILQATLDAGFTMASEVMTCSLLRTLAASKPGGSFLELGTGTGLSTSWIIDGMNAESRLVSVDNDPNFLDIARRFLPDSRICFILEDGGAWALKNKDERFDYIFADTWHGKYIMLEEVLSMLKPGGLYIIDDMLQQTNWPDGHAEKALALEEYLDKREDLIVTKQKWASGMIIAVKK